MLRSVCVLLLLTALASARAATAMTLEGEVVKGERARFDARGQQVQIDGRAVALADLDWIEPGDSSGLAVFPGKRQGVWLVDGSWLPVGGLSASDADDRLDIASPVGELSLPLAAVAGWGAGDLPGRPEDKSDTVLLASGEQQGQVLGVAAAGTGERKLRFKTSLDPKPIELDLGDVLGCRIAGAVRPVKGISFAAALDDVHAPLRLVLGKAADAEGGSPLVLAATPDIAAGGAIQRLRLTVEGGRRIYLGDLKGRNSGRHSNTRLSRWMSSGSSM